MEHNWMMVGKKNISRCSVLSRSPSISLECVDDFLSYIANGQTNQQRQNHNLLVRGKNRTMFDQLLACTSRRGLLDHKEYTPPCFRRATGRSMTNVLLRQIWRVYRIRRWSACRRLGTWLEAARNSDATAIGYASDVNDNRISAWKRQLLSQRIDARLSDAPNRSPGIIGKYWAPCPLTLHSAVLRTSAIAFRTESTPPFISVKTSLNQHV